MKNFKAGIDKVYKSLVTESEVPEVTTDDFVMFLQWMAKRTNEDGDALYTPLNIADVVAEPQHYSKEFTEYQSWRESEFGNHILHPNEDTAPLVPRKQPEIGGEGMFRLEIDRGTGELIGEYQIDGSGWYKFDGIEFKNLSTGESTTSPTRIQRQLARAIRFNPDFQEDGAPKYDVTSPATRASADAGGPMTEVGRWMVSILWGQEENKPLEAGESWNFKLVPETTINRR
jgi:hypothetical protein